jgi:hypothetical protein
MWSSDKRKALQLGVPLHLSTSEAQERFYEHLKPMVDCVRITIAPIRPTSCWSDK